MTRPQGQWLTDSRRTALERAAVSPRGRVSLRANQRALAALLVERGLLEATETRDVFAITSAGRAAVDLGAEAVWR